MPNSSPDIGAAVLQYLKDSADLTDPSVVGNRIFLEWPIKDDAIKIPTSNADFANCILIEGKRGGVGDIGGGLYQSRVIFKCYGVNKLQASFIWRVLNYYLMKPDGRTQSSFTKANTMVCLVATEGAPNELYDSDAAGWPYIEAPYIFTYGSAKV